MPIPMPYYLEKGPFFAVLEDYFNSGPTARLVTALQGLRRGDPWEAFEFFGSPSLQKPNRGPAVDWVEHLNKHWFGKKPSAQGGWVQPPFDGVKNPQTGYWVGYYGNVEAITRATLIRALEVALGVDHTDDAAAPINPTRRWYVDFLWKCSQDWFEGWVTWRRTRRVWLWWHKRAGHVTVVFATPPVQGSVVLDSPLAGRNEPEFLRIGPPSAPASSQWITKATNAKHGMWVVTHTHNTGYAGVAAPPATTGNTTSNGTTQGLWPWPRPGRVHATGEVVTVAPSMADGGVLADGLTYSPPT